jgi:hypothetical protein
MLFVHVLEQLPQPSFRHQPYLHCIVGNLEPVLLLPGVVANRFDLVAQGFEFRQALRGGEGREYSRCPIL